MEFQALNDKQIETNKTCFLTCGDIRDSLLNTPNIKTPLYTGGPQVLKYKNNPLEFIHSKLSTPLAKTL